MKKIIGLIVILVSLIGFGSGSVAYAVGVLGPNECCKTNQIIKYSSTDADIQANVIVGPSATAQCDLNEDGTQDINIVENPEWGMICLLNTVYTVTNWIFYLLTLIAVLMIIYGGFTYITAAGDPAKATKGKGILTFAVIGLAIALLAKFIPSLVRFNLGM
jgi:hypothetical protein